VPKISLSDVGLQNLIATSTTDFWDTSFRSGLFGCRVSPKGTKTFILKIDNGRRSLGRYPLVKLSEARAEAKRLLAERTLRRVRPESVTYDTARRLFLDECRLKNKPRTAAEYERLLARLNFTGQLSRITPPEVARKLAAIESIAERSHIAVAGKILCNWAIKRHYIDRNPFVGILVVKSTPRSRVLTDDELKSIWRACEQTGDADESNSKSEGNNAPLIISSPRLPANFATIVKLLILTGQRRGEIAQLQTSWLDLENKTITIPASVAKNAREQTIPMCTLCQSILTTSQHRATTTYIFPARHSGTLPKPFNGWSKSKAALDKVSGVSGWTLHDLRRTVATRLAEMGVAPHVIERLLNHVSGQISGVAAVYNRARYVDEMRQALELWEQKILAVVHGGA
jgi:integrase